MATFKVGQRVRIIRTDPVPGRSSTLGREAIIIALDILGVTRKTRKEFRGHEIIVAGFEETFCSPPDWIVPLTDPKADAFIERIKKLAHEPAPRTKEPA